MHLTLDPTPGDVDIPGGSGKINCDAQYIISILKLKDDIKNSVIRPGGYMETVLRRNFVDAINQIFDPICYKFAISAKASRPVNNIQTAGPVGRFYVFTF